MCIQYKLYMMNMTTIDAPNGMMLYNSFNYYTPINYEQNTASFSRVVLKLNSHLHVFGFSAYT
jgi:hypothetical protein